MTIGTIFALAGGLGLFLYGMKLMSDGLTNVAGDKLRSVLEKMTKNVIMGTLVGTFFTAVIQSSNATTVLVVSFVNAELMNLYQAIGIIFGANIGTTMTGLLMTFNLSEIAPFIVFLGVVMVQFIKKPSVQKVGQVILGFGILFVGLSSMSAAMSAMKDTPMIVDLLTSLTNPVLAILIGAAVTAVLQSASAMVGILIVLASQGLVSIEMCFYLTLGCNIGCTTSAIMSSLSGTTNAKRAAMIHLIINIIGTIVMGTLLVLFMPYMISFITTLTGSSTATGAALSTALGKDVAYSNTIFKIFQIIICLPFYKSLVHLSEKIIPDKEDKHVGEFRMKYISGIFSQATAIPQAVNEVQRMFYKTVRNLNMAVESLLERDVEVIEKINKNKEYIDFLDDGLNEYLRKCNTYPLPEDDSRMIAPLIHVIADIVRIAERTINITEATQKCVEKDIEFSDEHKLKIREFLTLINSELEYSIDMFSKKSIEHLAEICKLEDLIDTRERELQHEYLSDMNNRITRPRAGLLFSDLADNLERIGDHGVNIAFSILNRDGEEINKLLSEEHFDPAEYIV